MQAIFDAADAEILMAGISLAELGRRLRDLGAPEPAIQETLAGYRLLCEEVAPVDAAAALAALEISRLTPRRLPLVDALLAAVAQEHAAVLVHRDEHLRAVPADLVRQQDLTGC